MFKVLEDEKEFAAKITEYINQVEKNDKVILTKFLSLREQQIIEYLTKNNTINYQFFGGHKQAERKRCLLYLSLTTVSDNLFNISCFKIKYNKRYLTLTHQNVLGTLMSLKMDRSLFGDISFSNNECYIFISSDIESILLNEFKTINRVPITLEKVTENISVEEKFITKEIIISSMRIDNLISHVYNLSRNDTSELILSNYVYRNWQIVTNQAIKCNVSDIISVRKYGRFVISQILRSTKADKLVLEIKIPTI